MNRAVVILGMKDVPSDCNHCPFKDQATFEHAPGCRALSAVNGDFTVSYPDKSHCPLRSVQFEGETKQKHWRKI